MQTIDPPFEVLDRLVPGDLPNLAALPASSESPPLSRVGNPGQNRPAQNGVRRFFNLPELRNQRAPSLYRFVIAYSDEVVAARVVR